MKILITGSDGMLGTDFVKTLKNTSHEVIASTIKDLDITSKEEVLKKIKNTKPDMVINFAAYTSVDACETNKELCYKINITGLKNIIEACKEEDIILLHMSTSYVFDGSKESYNEDDETSPINYYGKTKADGERLIQEMLTKYYIVRTSWLFGKHGKNFVNAIVEKSEKEKDIKVINNQFGMPTYTIDLSYAIIELFTKPFGIYHLTNSGSCSWYEFALEIKKIKELESNILPCSDSEYERVGKRPKYSLLKNNKIKPLRDWKLALKEYFNEGVILK